MSAVALLKDPEKIVPSMHWDALPNMGAPTTEMAVGELVDNTIQADPSKKVRVEITLTKKSDPMESTIEVKDDSCGMPRHILREVWNYGKRDVSQVPMQLSMMGIGMKSAIGGLGDLHILTTKVRGGTTHGVVRDPDSTTVSYLLAEIDDNNPEYDEHNIHTLSGTYIKIKDADKAVKDWTAEKDFRKFCHYFDVTYANYIREGRLEIVIRYRNFRHRTTPSYDYKCRTSVPLMSDPRHIIDPDINMGANQCTTDPFGNMIKDRKIVGQSGMVNCRIDAFNKPTPAQVAEMYKATKDEVYNLVNYNNSVWAYGSKTAGLTVVYKGKVIDYNVEVASRSFEDKGVIVYIDDSSGLSFRQFKGVISKDAAWDELIKAIFEELKRCDFTTRSRSGALTIPEREMYEKIRSTIKASKRDRMFFGLEKDADVDTQVQIKVPCPVGEVDVLCRDKNGKIVHIIEVKKDECSGETVAQAMKYALYSGCPNVTIISGVPPTATFHETVKTFKEAFPNFGPEGLDIDYLNINHLNAGIFFGVK